LLFRSDSVGQALGMMRSIIFSFSIDPGIADVATKLALFALPLLIVQIYQHRFGLAPWDGWRTESQLLAVMSAVLLVALMGAPNRTQFIYFQF